MEGLREIGRANGKSVRRRTTSQRGQKRKKAVVNRRERREKRRNRPPGRKKRRLSTRTPAHESYRLWLLDLSPDQVHRLPLQGPSLKVVFMFGAKERRVETAFPPSMPLLYAAFRFREGGFPGFRRFFLKFLKKRRNRGKTT